MQISDSSFPFKLDVNTLLKTNKEYYLKFIEVHSINLSLKEQLTQLLQERNDLKHLIERLDRKHKIKSNAMSAIDDLYIKKKRFRRGKEDIAREFVCKYPQCKEKYGSEGSLNQHIKLKHHGKEFEKK